MGLFSFFQLDCQRITIGFFEHHLRLKNYRQMWDRARNILKKTEPVAAARTSRVVSRNDGSNADPPPVGNRREGPIGYKSGGPRHFSRENPSLILNRERIDNHRLPCGAITVMDWDTSPNGSGNVSGGKISSAYFSRIRQ